MSSPLFSGRPLSGGLLCAALLLGCSDQILVITDDDDATDSPGPGHTDPPATATPGSSPTPEATATPTVTPAPTDTPAAPETPTLEPAGAPEIELSRTSIQFGEVPLASSALAWLSVDNRGDAPLTLTYEMRTGAPMFGMADTINPAPELLAPGQGASFILEFVPAGLGPASGTLVIHSNDPDEAEVVVALEGTGVPPITEDIDGDGFTTGEGDCNDYDPSSHPGAMERCDGRDNDCDGQIDEEGPEIFFRDQDGDTWGDARNTKNACSMPPGYVERPGDCDDQDPTVNPDAEDPREDGIDQNCDGEATPYIDLNLDGWPDLVVANYYSQVKRFNVESTIFWGSAGGLSPGSRTDLPTVGAAGACVADFNQDGFPDLAFANYFNGTSFQLTSYVYWGQVGGPNAGRRTDLPTMGAVDCAVGDINADGYPDLAFAGRYEADEVYDSTAFVYYGGADGLQPYRSTSIPSEGNYSVVIADVNADGYGDLIQSNHYHPTKGGFRVNSYVYFGEPSGIELHCRRAYPTQGAWNKAVVHDLNGDGYKELIFNGFHDNEDYDAEAFIFWGAEDGPSTTGYTALPMAGGGAAWAGDLDADGYDDVVLGFQYDGDYTGNAMVYWGSVTGFSAGDHTRLPSYSSPYIAVDDLDLDGRFDLVFPNQRTGEAYQGNGYLYMGGPAGYSVADRVLLPENSALDADTCDFDLDGFPDVVFAGSNNGTTTQTEGYVYWGSSQGHQSGDRLALPMDGGYRLTVGVDPN